ncbi:NADAR family protein [Hydrogenophaga sp. NFH-34]|uniref:NADAR family protein n=1 Tax=Hydrogenophaga sp. NFH-34 TaxID=2744446 RepID=UPI001F24BF38|nr:NADAR family protein [Hydrogenophaga sp. NFH-34]
MSNESTPTTASALGILIRDIEHACQGTATWYVMNADESGYCMSFDHHSHSNPAAACEKWMSEQNPTWIAANGYHVVQERSLSRIERLARDAASALRDAERKLNELFIGSRAIKNAALRTRGMVDGRRQPDAYGLANAVQAYSNRMMEVIRGDIAADVAPFSGTEVQSRAAGFIKPDNDHSVYFYEQDYYVLSNFSAFTLMWKGRRFDTSEAAYHWEKFPHLPHVQESILAAPSAHDAFKIAEGHGHVKRSNWDELKVGIMREILRQKVLQHTYVRRKLLSTGGRTLVEDSWRDGFWGWGEDGLGLNMLGRLWMEIRAELHSAGVTAESTMEVVAVAMGLTFTNDVSPVQLPTNGASKKTSSMKHKAGDWVCDGSRIARVKEVYEPDGISLEGSLDLVLYARDGNRIGRESEALDGPKGYEPMCSATAWRRIEKPAFPLSKFDFLKNQVIFID